MTVTQARGPNSVPRAHMNNQGRAVPVCNPSPGAGEETGESSGVVASKPSLTCTCSAMEVPDSKLKVVGSWGIPEVLMGSRNVSTHMCTTLHRKSINQSEVFLFS